MHPAPVRRFDLDALRVFATYLLFPFHVAMIFNPSPFFHVRNDDTSALFFVACGFVGIWHMPLFFLLAGWSAAASLDRRSPLAFLRERWRRLGVPLVAGCVSFMPVIKWLELRSGQDLSHRGYAASEAIRADLRSLTPVEIPLAPPFQEDFLSFWPSFFTDLDRFTWSHLWFVAYLLTFSVVLLPILLAVARRAPGPAHVGRWWAYAPILPLAAIQLLLRERFPGPYNLYSDWANVSYFATFLLCGFALRVVPALEVRVHEESSRLFALALAATGVLLAAVLGAFASTPVVLIATAVACWGFVAALLGVAHRRVQDASGRLDAWQESAFPVYVLHQPVIVVLGAAVVGLPFGIGAKFSLLLGASLATTLAIYHLAVRRSRLLRAALGMKPLPRADASQRIRSGVSRAWRSVVGLALIAVPLAADAAAQDPTGLWWAEGGAAQVEITHCDDALCGRVHWLRSPIDENGCDLRDVVNPDPARRTTPVLGLDVLRVRAAPASSGEWNGDVYDPGSGRTYAAVVRMDGPDRLRVLGYVGIRLLGRTTTWLRVGTEGQCRGDA